MIKPFASGYMVTVTESSSWEANQASLFDREQEHRGSMLMTIESISSPAMVSGAAVVFTDAVEMSGGRLEFGSILAASLRGPAFSVSHPAGGFDSEEVE